MTDEGNLKAEVEVEVEVEATKESTENTKVVVDKDFLKGMPKSGKPWKKNSERFNRLNRSNVGLQTTWEFKMKLRNNLKATKELSRKHQQEKDDARKKMIDNWKAKQKRKQVNEIKSSTYQLIKNSTKIKKWDKKARATLTKLPAELYEKALKKAQW